MLSVFGRQTPELYVKQVTVNTKSKTSTSQQIIDHLQINDKGTTSCIDGSSVSRRLPRPRKDLRDLEHIVL
mgnify:CR=1 FL=1